MTDVDLALWVQGRVSSFSRLVGGTIPRLDLMIPALPDRALHLRPYPSVVSLFGRRVYRHGGRRAAKDGSEDAEQVTTYRTVRMKYSPDESPTHLTWHSVVNL